MFPQCINLLHCLKALKGPDAFTPYVIKLSNNCTDLIEYM